MNDIDKYPEIFIPGSPIKDRKYLLGRTQELQDLHNILIRPGQHAIITGDRGVGKTSLVKQALGDFDLLSAWRTCDKNSNFDLVVCDLLDILGRPFQQQEITNKKSKKGNMGLNISLFKGNACIANEVSTKTTINDLANITPWQAFTALQALENKSILVIDEYDAIHRTKYSKSFSENIAYLMKNLADHNDKCDSRMFIIGVARSAQNLLGKHESIQRSAREIYLRPLRKNDIYDFLELAENDLGIKFQDQVKNHLASGSLGYPYFLHLVGLECIEAMLSRDRNARIIELTDYNNGLQKAIEQAVRGELSKYESTERNLNEDELLVVQALASMPEKYPTKANLINYCRMANNLDEQKTNSALLSLFQDKRFIYISERSDHVGFIDPLMKPFLTQKEVFISRKKKKKKNTNTQLTLFDD